MTYENGYSGDRASSPKGERMPEEKIPVDEKTLELFLDSYLFSRTAAHIYELEKDRKAYRKRTDIERHQITGDKENKLKSLSILHEYMTDVQYQRAYKKIHKKYDKKMNDWKKRQGTADQNPYKGKDTTDLNNFIYGCYYSLKKYLPVPKKDTEIYKWIEACLTRKDIKMKNGKPYDKEAIKTRVYDFKKKMGEDIGAFERYLDYVFKRFIDEIFKRFIDEFRKPKPTTPTNNFHVRLTI